MPVTSLLLLRRQTDVYRGSYSRCVGFKTEQNEIKARREGRAKSCGNSCLSSEQGRSGIISRGG